MDKNLEKGIRAVIKKPKGDILKDDMQKIKEINIDEMDIKPIPYFLW